MPVFVVFCLSESKCRFSSTIENDRGNFPCFVIIVIRGTRYLIINSSGHVTFIFENTFIGFQSKSHFCVIFIKALSSQVINF